MIRIKDLREYFESLVERTNEIYSVTLVTVDKDMSDALRQMKREDFPALFVVVPSSDDNSDYPDIKKHLPASQMRGAIVDLST